MGTTGGPVPRSRKAKVSAAAVPQIWVMTSNELIEILRALPIPA